MADDLKPWEKAAKQATSSTELKPWEKASQKKTPFQNDVESTSTSLPNGGVTDLNSLTSGNSQEVVPSVLTNKGAKGYLNEQLSPTLNTGFNKELGRDYLGKKTQESKEIKKVQDNYLPNANKRFKSPEYNENDYLEGIGAPILPSNREIGESDGIQNSNDRAARDGLKAYEEAQGKKAADTIRNVDAIKEEAKQANKKGGVGDSFMAGMEGFNKGIYKIPRYVYELAAVPQNYIAEKLNMPELVADYENVKSMTGDYSPLTVLDKLGDVAAGNEEAYQNRVKQYNDGIVESISKGNFSDAGAQIANSISQSIPAMVGMAMTSGASNASKLSYVHKTLANALPFASSQNENLRQEDVPEYIRPISAGLNALAEVIFDQSFGTQAAIENVAKLFAEEGREVAVNSAKEMAKGYLGKAMSGIGGLKSIAKGSLEEMTTTFSQNLVNKVTVNPEQDLMEGVLDAGVVGSVMTGGVSIGGKALAGRYNKSQKKELETLSKQRSDIVDDLDKPNVPDEVKASLNDNLEVIDAKIDGITEDAEAEIESLPQESKEAVIERQSELEAIETQIQSEDITDTTKDILKEKAKSLETELNEIIDNAKSEENAIQEQSTAQEIPRIGETGENITESSEGVRQSEQRQSPTEQSQEIIQEEVIPDNSERIAETQTTIEETKAESQPIKEQTTTEQISNAEDTTVVESVKGGKALKDIGVTIEKDKTSEGFYQVYKDNKFVGLLGATSFEQARNKGQYFDEGLMSDILSKLGIEHSKAETSIQGENEFLTIRIKSPKSLNESLNPISKTESTKPKESLKQEPTKLQKAKETPVVEETVSEQVVDSPIQETVPTNIPKERIAEIQVKRQTIKDNIKSKLKAQRGQLSSGFDPSLLSDFVELGKTYAEEGVVRAEDFIKRFREDYRDIGFDDAELSDDQIISGVFDKVNSAELSNNPIENEALNTELSETTLKNDDVEQKRKDYGFDAPLPRKGQTDEELRIKAKEAIDKGYDVYDLMDKAFNREPITGVESVILAQFQATKEAQLIEANRKIEDSKNQSVTAFENAVTERDKILDDLVKAYDASELSGTVASDALRARKVKVLQDYSLAGMLIKYRKANNNDTLTPEQIQEVTDRYQKLTEAEEKLNARIEQLEKENTELRAKEEIIRIRKQQEIEDRRAKRTRTKEALKTEREDIFEQMRKLANKQRGTLSANPIPVEMLPLIARLVKNYVADGIVNIEDIVQDIHSKLTDVIDEVTIRDVRDAISGYGYETTKTKSELQEDIRNLKQQAKVISQIEDAEQGLLKTKENTPRRNEITDKLKGLRYELSEFTKDAKDLKGLKTRVQNQIKELEKRIRTGNFDKPTKKGVALDEEALKLRDTYRRIKFEFDVELEKQKLAQRTRFQKYKDLVVEVANIPRALMATADLSAPLRQGLLPTISNPIMAGKAFKEMMKQWGDQDRADRWLNDLKDSPGYQLMEESDLYIADKSNPNVAAREEDFMTNLAEKIPVLGGDTEIGGKTIPGLVQASERAYVGYLNKMRVDLFTRGVDALEMSGVTFANNPQAYKALAKYINAATGRGDLGETLNRAAPILNAAFFSPRLMASRLQLLTNWLNPKFYKETPLAVKKMYFGDMAKLLAFGTSILALAALSGADVEDDPRSPDFGKIRNGDTRWDIWGGFQQYVRVFAQLAWGEKKSTASGRITPLDGTSYNKETRLTQAWSFIRGKFAPVPSFMYNAVAGQNTIGQPFKFREELKNMLFPLVGQGIFDSAKQDGWAFAVGATGLPSIFGVGVQTYGVNSFLDKGVDNKLVDLLIDKKAVAIEPKDGERKVYDIDSGEDRDMTSAEFKRYYDKWVSYIKGDLKANYNEYKGMSAEKFEKRFRSIKIEATKAAKSEIIGFSNEDLTIRYNEEVYELTKPQLKDRIRYMKEYKDENGSDFIDSYIESEVEDGKPRGQAEREANKRLQSKAREYSKKIILDDIGIENLKKKED